jgi:predicted nucleic acid-binding protein
MIVVADTSPLNYLLLIDAAHVVQPLFGEVIIPSAVQRELCHPGAPAIVKACVAQPPAWLRIASPAAVLPDLDLDAGEAEAISLYLEIHADALLIDDRKGRVEATRRGLKTISTITILEAAAQQDLLSLEEAFRRLLKTNFRVAPRLLAEALERHRQRPKD